MTVVRLVWCPAVVRENTGVFTGQIKPRESCRVGPDRVTVTGPDP